MQSSKKTALSVSCPSPPPLPSTPPTDLAFSPGNDVPCREEKGKKGGERGGEREEGGEGEERKIGTDLETKSRKD